MKRTSKEDNEAHLAMFTIVDPIHFDDALKSEKLRRVIDVEMEAIRNGQWESMDLSEGSKKLE